MAHLLLEGLVLVSSLGVANPVGNVHPRPTALVHRRPVKALGGLDHSVDPLRLFLAGLLKVCDSSLLLHPIKHQPRHVNGKGGRCVEERLVVCRQLEVHDRRRDVQLLS